MPINLSNLPVGCELPDVPEAEREAEPEAERLPFDPMQPLELDDGTPIRLQSANLSNVTWAWTVELLEEGAVGGLSRCIGRYHFTRNGGFSDGSINGSEGYPRIRNVDFSVPELIRQRRREYARIGGREKPDFIADDWYAPLADLHFAKLADVEGVAMVSFYENERKLEADRRTEMRVGRYVRRFCGGKLKDEDVERVAAASDVKLRGNRVKLTQDADEIESIYVNGPRSCMACSARDYDTDGIHPARVYAGPDLAIAYLGEVDDPSARCVVWPEKKRYNTIYGDYSRMRQMLESMGYEEGSISGARVRLIECDQGIVMPYVDGIWGASADYEANVCTLGGYGDVETSNTNGLGVGGNRTYCERCEDRVDEDDTVCVETGRYAGETWCSSCADCHAVYSDSYGATIVEDRAVEVHDIHGDTDYRPNWDLGDFVEVTAGDRAGEYWHCDATVEVGFETYHEDDAPEIEEDADGVPPVTVEEAEAAGQMALPMDAPSVEFQVRGTEADGNTFLCVLKNAGGPADSYVYASDYDDCVAQRAEIARLYPRIAYTIEPVGFAVEYRGRFYPAMVCEVDPSDPDAPVRVSSVSDEVSGFWCRRDGTATFMRDGRRAHNIPADVLEQLPSEALAIAA
jgi:hypothetical protein